MLDTVDVAPAQPAPFADAAPESLAPPAPPPVRWSSPTRVAFRFCFLYFTLYVLTTQMLGGLWIVPKISAPDMGATGWMQPAIDWTAAHVFHVSQRPASRRLGPMTE